MSKRRKRKRELQQLSKEEQLEKALNKAQHKIRASRPFGISLLAIIEILIGILMIFGAIGAFALIAPAEEDLPYGEHSGEIYLGLGIIILAVAILSIVLGFALWCMYNFARNALVVISVIWIISSFGSIILFNICYLVYIFSIIIGIVIIYYLKRNDIVIAFEDAEKARKNYKELLKKNNED
ncbi:MAG: hypothetical protein KAJ51_15670 [Thermoplasmata archaeon]|nr:hypothetical protein [Thermoplasmata archaeon]